MAVSFDVSFGDFAAGDESEAFDFECLYDDAGAVLYFLCLWVCEVFDEVFDGLCGLVYEVVEMYGDVFFLCDLLYCFCDVGVESDDVCFCGGCE